MDLRLHADRSCCVCGPSQSGKTSFVLKLLDHREELFRTQPQRVLWCYGIYQHELHQELIAKGYELHAGLITVSDIKPYDIIVLDDLLNESKNSQDVTNMIIKAAHHKPCFVIFIMQNIFPPGKEARTRSLNTHYYVIFKNPRDKSQIEVLARQVLPKNSKAILNIFEAATKEPHQYLFIDFTQECPEENRYRTNLFNPPISLYRPE